MSKNQTLLVLSFLVLGFASCSTQQIRVPVLRPAPVDLGQFDIVAVDRFTGEAGDVMADEFTHMLRNATNPMTGNVEFEVLSRTELDVAIDGLRGRGGSSTDDQTQAVLDRWRNADVVLHGDVESYEVEEQINEEERKNKEGIYSVFSRQATAFVSITLSATDTAGNSLFDQTTIQEQVRQSTRPTAGEPPEIDYEALMGKARQRVLERYLKRVMPHQVWVAVSLYTDGSLPELDIGNGFAKTGAWDTALEQYRRGVETANMSAPDSKYKALFNLGVALQYTNQFDEATQTLQEAYALGRDSMILAQIQRVQARAQEYERLVKQGDRSAQPGR